ncbi:MAG TPA: Plug domain-containing protein, partial [Sphingomicrobium sp.]|nr:Plug domain-containing protein [Sphingomicrobium sp.]
MRIFALAGTAMAVLAAGSPALASQPAPAAKPPTGPASGSRTTAYDAAFFAQYAPRTAYDIVQRIPGFTLDLGVNNTGLGTADIRGFAGVAGNVVINGQRPSTKSETLDVYLTRIPASRVKRVEVGPGDLFGADFTSKTQVANLILEDGGGGVAGNVTVSAERHYTGVITPTGTGSVSFTKGPSTFNIAGDTSRFDFTEKGTDVLTDAPTGELIEFRQKVNKIFNYSPFISGSWAFEKTSTDSAHINLRYHFDHFVLHQFNHVIPTGEPVHDDRLVEDYPTKTFELGGDVTQPLLGGAIKFVGLASRQRRNTLDEYDSGNLGHTEVVGGSQQLSNSQRNETLGRLTWTKANML